MMTRDSQTNCSRSHALVGVVFSANSDIYNVLARAVNYETAVVCTRASFFLDHLLSLGFGQYIAVAQVVDLDILDVIAIGRVHFAVNRRSIVSASRWGRGEDVFDRLRSARSLNRGDVYVLNALSCLELRVNFRGGGSYQRVSSD